MDREDQETCVTLYKVPHLSLLLCSCASYRVKVAKLRGKYFFLSFYMFPQGALQLRVCHRRAAYIEDEDGQRISRSYTAIVGFLGEQGTKPFAIKRSPRARAKLSKGFPFFMEAQ